MFHWRIRMGSDRNLFLVLLAIVFLFSSLEGFAQGSFSFTAPGNGASAVLPSATLPGEESRGATSYIVRIGTTNPPSAVNDHTVTGTSFEPIRSGLGPLRIGLTYYWLVTAVAVDGSRRINNGGVQSFTTAPTPRGPHPLYTPPDKFEAPISPSVGAWAPLTNQPPVAVTNCLLLTDGRVMCQQAQRR